MSPSPPAAVHGRRRRPVGRRHPAWLSTTRPPVGLGDGYLAEPATTEATIIELEALLARFDATDDHRRWFCRMYLTMTRRTVGAIDAGTFEDPAWLRAFVARFADRYLQAVDAADAGRIDQVPPAWRIAFTRAEHTEPAVLLDVMLGMNAHVNHDLAFCVHEVLAAEAADLHHDGRLPLPRLDLLSRQRDFTAVDAVLAATIDPVLTELADLAGPLLRPEECATFSRAAAGVRWGEGIAGWRNDAWWAAHRLHRASPLAVEAHRVARTATNWGRLIVTLDRYQHVAERWPAMSVDWLLEDPTSVYAWMRRFNRFGGRLPRPVERLVPARRRSEKAVS